MSANTRPEFSPIGKHSLFQLKTNEASTLSKKAKNFSSQIMNSDRQSYTEECIIDLNQQINPNPI